MSPLIHIRFSALAFLALGLGIVINATTGAGAERSSEWKLATPEECGLDSAALVEMFDFVRTNPVPVHSVQIVRHGRLAVDAYFYPFSKETRHDVASVTKSVTATLVGLAIDKGHLPDVQQPLIGRFPERTIANLDSRKRRVTLEHLLTMSAGWDCGFEAKEARLGEMRRSNDWLQFMLDLPMVAEPGTRWAYCSGNCHVLSVLLTQVTGTNALAFARRELFTPLGIGDVMWPADSRGNNDGWGDLQLHPLDMAKLGQLMLQGGRWNGQQVIPNHWITTATRPHVQRTSNKDHYGYFWWVKGTNYPGMFEAVGRGGQRITVWPAKDLVVVFTGGGFEPGDLAPFLLKALKSDESLPGNAETLARLRQRIADATKPPPARPVPRLPPLAALISAKKYNLSANALGLTAISLNFDASSAAQTELFWNGHSERCRLGLDGVERFSTNTLFNLPCAAKGEWLTKETFLLQVDLVGGINCYRFKLAFSQDVRKLRVDLNERTGLVDEQFEGIATH
jgi:CubicO group peptidase (beta-lactamase class C family)